jgi:glycosyltransferase involved in cell wall biosynthesis
LTMAQFIPLSKKEYFLDRKYLSVFDAHNATYSIVERMQKTSVWFLKPIYVLEAMKVKNYEASIIKNFDHTLAVSKQDRQLLIEACNDEPEDRLIGGRIKVIPIAVDTVAMQPIQRLPGSHNIVTIGTLHYLPNADGIRWFIQEIFPKIKSRVGDATLTIIGKNPPADFLQFSGRSNGAIKVTGYVKELEPLLSEAALMVVPVRAGGGMRVRILEALSRGMPVVTTTVGLEGIEAQIGDDVLVSDDASEFADEVVRLLEDTHLQSCLAENGRNLAEHRYDWRVVLKKMDEIYASN